MKYLALGDSYTIGEAVAPTDRWPALLANELDLGEPLIIAKTGWTTDELRDAIEAADPKGPFDLVTLLIGVNNQYRGRDAGEYRNEFAELLDWAIAFAADDASRALVVSIPDWGATRFAEGRDREQIGREIDRFNAINHDETMKRGARYADITAISRRAANDATLTASDHLHPSGKMYRLWLPVILRPAREALAGR